MTKQSRSEEKGGGHPTRVSKPNTTEEDGINNKDSCDSINKHKVPSRGQLCGQSEHCQSPDTDSPAKQRCINVAQQDKKGCNGSTSHSKKSASPEESKQENSTGRKSLRLKTQNKHPNYYIKQKKYRKFIMNDSKEVLILWDDGLINIVNSGDLYRSDDHYRSKVYKVKPKLELGAKVKMRYNRRWYYGSILSLDEAEFVQVASKYPKKHFLLRDPAMVPYKKKPKESTESDRVPSEDEDFKMVFGDDSSDIDLDSRSFDKEALSERNEVEMGVLSECIEVQTIKFEDFDAMGEEVVIDLPKSEPNLISPRNRSSANKLSGESSKISISDLIKPCSVIIESNIANEMNMTDVYLVDQQVKISLPDSDSDISNVTQSPVVTSSPPVTSNYQSKLCPVESTSTPDIFEHLSSLEDVSVVNEPPLVKSLLPVKLENPSQICPVEYKLTPEISDYLSSCKEIEIFPTKTTTKSKSPTKQNSPEQNNKVKSKPPRNPKKSTKHKSALKVKNLIKDNFSKLIASKLYSKGVDIIPIENLETNQSISDDLISHQSNLDKSPGVLPPETTEQIFTLESSIETITSQSSSSINRTEMCVSNQTSKTGNTLNFDTTTFAESPSSVSKDVHTIAPSLPMSTNNKVSPNKPSSKIHSDRLNSKDYKELQIPSTSTDPSPCLSHHSSDGSDDQNHLTTVSVRNCDILLKEPSLADCIDGVPPFIQEVFLCDNIRDGFINSDLVFVLSLLPDMEEMTDTQKFSFQMKVIETLTEVLDDPQLQIKGVR